MGTPYQQDTGQIRLSVTRIKSYHGVNVGCELQESQDSLFLRYSPSSYLRGKHLVLTTRNRNRPQVKRRTARDVAEQEPTNGPRRVQGSRGTYSRKRSGYPTNQYHLIETSRERG